MRVALAGAVGIGKSTLAKALGDYYQLPVIYEEVSSNPYLASYYEDLSRWSFHLQTYFLVDRVEKLKNITKKYSNGYIQDRSIYEDIEIFAKMLKEQGNMTNVEYDTYQYLFNEIVYQKEELKPEVIIYLTGSFERIVERIRNRGRAMEQNTPISFWKDLHTRYETWYQHWDVEIPIVKIDIAEYDLLNEPSTIELIVDKIQMIKVK